MKETIFDWPFAELVVGIDQRWVQRRRKELLGLPQTRVLTGARVTGPGIVNLARTISPGLSLCRGIIHANYSSGHAAVNLAVLCGARRVELLGFDYGERGADHHYDVDRYPWRTGARPFDWDKAAAVFQDTAAHLAVLGVEVVSCTPGSRLTMFPTEERYAWL